MSNRLDKESLLVSDMCVVRILNGYSIVTTDNLKTVLNLFEKVKHRLNVSVEINPVVVCDHDEVGCGRFALGAIPNTHNDDWETGYSTAWFPTGDEDTYVIVFTTVIPDSGVITLLWAGLVFVAASANINEMALPALGMMKTKNGGEDQ